MVKCDFSGWATVANLKCSDGRIIAKDAFKHHDGTTVPMVWNHQHNSPDNVLGQALLEHRDEGLYAYCTFNDSESGQTAKLLVQHGDVDALSICAGRLKQQGPYVQHGVISEVSLVLAGANPGAHIENIMMHGEVSDDAAMIYTDEHICLYHAEDDEKKEEEEMQTEEIKHADETKGKTMKEIFDSMTAEQQEVTYAMIGMALEEKDDDSEGGNEEMKQNAFDKETMSQDSYLTHADQVAILEMAKKPSCGSLKAAFEMYAEEKGTMMHGFVDEEGNDAIDQLFPDYKLLKPGAPELITRDLTWVDYVLNGIHKSPITRIRTRYADARIAELRAKGYNDRSVAKSLAGNIKLIGRTTDPQTVYRKDEMHRDDILDITDFDVVEYNWKIMRQNMNEELALAALIGDGREEDDPDKIHESHIRSIWNDDELYTIHVDVDYEAAKKELQGTNTGANFGENYIRSEATVNASMYAREKYKGSGNVTMFCTPHALNVMLLARDLNGRRLYSSKTDLAAALNVNSIHTIEQFEGKIRTDKAGKKHKLMALMVNLSDYQFGCAKGGEITRFDDFDIDFNKYKYLMETRLSGSLTKLWSAIALEEPVTE